MAIPANGTLWFLCAMVIAVMATYVRMDAQPQGNSEADAGLAKQVNDLKRIVYAHSEEVRDLKAVVQSQELEIRDLRKVVLSQGEEVQELKGVVKTQREEVRVLTVSLKKQRTQIRDLRVRGQSQRGHVDNVENYGNGIHDDQDDVKPITTAQRTPVLGGKFSRGIREVTGVAFFAYLNHDLIDMDTDQTIVLESVLLNDGNAYNTHTGIFTAPISGVYLFTYTIADWGNQGDSAGIRLVVDGAHQVDAIVYSGAHDIMGGNTAVLRVNSGQNVWLQTFYLQKADLRSGGAYRYVTFSGIRIY